MKITSGRPVRRKRGEPGAGLSAFRDVEIGSRTTHVGFDPARVRRVHLDRCIAQLVGEMDGEGVERCFGSVVREDLVGIDRRRGIGVERQGAHDTRDVHDASRRRFADQRKQPLGQRHGAEEVRLKSLPQDFHGKGTGRVGAWNKATGGGALLPDSGVVDQDVEPSVVTFDKVERFGMRARISHVKRDGIGRITFGPQGLGGGGSFFGIARAHDDENVFGTEFPGRLQAETPVSPGDEGYLLLRCFHEATIRVDFHFSKRIFIILKMINNQD
jgi:hypothetical protein